MNVEIPYSRLKTFYHVVVNRNFKTAAQALSVTEGAISQQIKDLESRLEKILFERSSRQVNLTPDGSILFGIISPIVERIDNLPSEFKERTGKIVGKVKIATFEDILLYIFPKYLEDFKTRYPDCELRLFNVPAKQIRALVSKGEVDFGVGSMEALPAGINGKELWRFQRYFIAPPGHPLCKKKRLTVEDITEYPLVIPDTEGASGETFDRVLRNYNPNFKVSVSTVGWQVVKKYVAMGFGVSMIPELTIQPKDRKSFYLKPMSDVVGYSHYGLLIKKQKYLSPAAKTFIRFLCPEFNFEEIDSPAPPP